MDLARRVDLARKFQEGSGSSGSRHWYPTQLFVALLLVQVLPILVKVPSGFARKYTAELGSSRESRWKLGSNRNPSRSGFKLSSSTEEELTTKLEAVRVFACQPREARVRPEPNSIGVVFVPPGASK